MNIITATKCEGRLHLGCGEEYSSCKRLGSSIKIFEFHPILHLVSDFFGFTIDIEVSGKIYCVSKESLKQQIQSIGLLGDINENYIKEIKKIGYNGFFEKNQLHFKLKSNENLGTNFSHKKRMKLFEKMISQLERNNTEAVARLVRKGAYVDHTFFTITFGAIGGQTIWSTRDKIEGVLVKHYSKATFYGYTPLALAAEKKNETLIKFFTTVKNNDTSADKKDTFTLSRSFPDRASSWNVDKIKTENITEQANNQLMNQSGK